MLNDCFEGNEWQCTGQVGHRYWIVSRISTYVNERMTTFSSRPNYLEDPTLLLSILFQITQSFEKESCISQRLALQK